MKKLIDKFRKDPTLTNAKKIFDYEFKHPMSLAMISEDDRVIYQVAKDFWDKTMATNPSLIRAA